VAVEAQTSWRQQPSYRWWNDPRVRALVYQAVAVLLVLALLGYLVGNTVDNLRRQNIASGFGFLDLEAGFAISESPISYTAADTYGRAFLVGLLNTFKVAALGIVLATALGVLVGVARLSSNWLVARLATAYVELLRNIPLLLQLFVWYGVITVSLPMPREALSPFAGVYLSNRGFQIPGLNPNSAYTAMGIALLAGLVAAIALRRWSKALQERTGRQFPIFSVGLGLILGLPLLAWLLGGAPIDLEMPQKSRFNITGGLALSPEFAALLLGLSTYTSAFIAEIVRSGVLAVSWGQSEAALSLGLTRTQTLRLVVLPQALRIIVPPTTSQYLNLVKNSSLAVAIGYPDLVSIGNTTLNQTGQAVEAVAIFMAVYLLISLVISSFMNWYNRRIALAER
jgi:general L-amino acid transport system permease protein